MKRLLIAGALCLAQAAPAAAATFTLATAAVSNGSLATDPGGLTAESPSTPGGVVSHKLTGTIDADVTPEALAADPDIPNFYEATASISIVGGPTIMESTGPFGPFSINDALASPLFGVLAMQLNELAADPEGYSLATTPEIAIPGLPIVPSIGPVGVEWDFNGITATDTTLDGDFYIGIVDDLSAEVAMLLGLPDLPSDVAFTAEFAITATPVPLPPAAALLLGGVAALAAFRRRA